MASFCDDRCTNATGKSCDCECGGANHGGFTKAVDRSEHENPLTLSDRELKNEIRALEKRLDFLNSVEPTTDKDLAEERRKEDKSASDRITALHEEDTRRERGGAQLGSVSHGTMQPRDLIPEFRSTLARLDQKAYRKHLEEHGDVTGDEDKDAAKGLDPEEADWAIEDLFDKLDSCAPDGAYFGAHPGDGADYGFWLAEE